MGFEYAKPKSASKKVEVKGPRLEAIVLETMEIVANVVGSTLGPGGQPVLIERYEHGLPATITKDGVTVMKSLGFDDPTAHVVMEAARDAAIRTASEAGDGTTTATILAEALVRYTLQFVKKNPRVSPQWVVRKLHGLFSSVIEPTVSELAKPANSMDSEGLRLLRAVAKVSANGDDELAQAVMTCFDLVGDDGNVTIVEESGPSRYEVEKIDGYPIPVGLEESCRSFWPKYVNDNANVRCVLEKPVFIVYHGKITEIQSLFNLLESVAAAWQDPVIGFNHNVVVVATGFSESVLGHLAVNFAAPQAINVFPLTAPVSMLPQGQLAFLQDVAALTGATLLDPLSKPLDRATLSDVGPGVVAFEAGKYRSSILGRASGMLPGGQGTYEDEIMFHIENIQSQLQSPNSELERMLMQERLAKVAGGIAKLKVIGSSSGELKERRDRAEDAVCAVRGAIKHGCLPGGGWTLMKLCEVLEDRCKPEDEAVVDEILVPALQVPVSRLLTNAGLSDDEQGDVKSELRDDIVYERNIRVYDALGQKFVDPFQEGILDSVPAVLEAIRNSISIATLLGTLGGTVVFKRDTELDRREARLAQQYSQDISNPADERW